MRAWLILAAFGATCLRMSQHGVVRRDEVEKLPDGFNGFWVCNPAGIIHLVSGSCGPLFGPYRTQLDSEKFLDDGFGRAFPSQGDGGWSCIHIDLPFY